VGGEASEDVTPKQFAPFEVRPVGDYQRDITVHATVLDGFPQVGRPERNKRYFGYNQDWEVQRDTRRYHPLLKPLLTTRNPSAQLAHTIH
jgi:hypothetical protein